MSVGVGQARLRDALKKLKLDWERTRDGWDDAARAHFEREFLSGIEQRMLTAMQAMSKLGEAIAAAKREIDG